MKYVFFGENSRTKHSIYISYYLQGILVLISDTSRADRILDIASGHFMNDVNDVCLGCNNRRCRHGRGLLTLSERQRSLKQLFWKRDWLQNMRGGKGRKGKGREEMEKKKKERKGKDSKEGKGQKRKVLH